MIRKVGIPMPEPEYAPRGLRRPDELEIRFLERRLNELESLLERILESLSAKSIR